MVVNKFVKLHAIVALIHVAAVALLADPAPAVAEHMGFAGKRLAVEVGILDRAAIAIGAHPVYYDDVSLMLEEVRRGRVAGVLMEMSHLRAAVKASGKEDIMRIIEVPADIFTISQIVISSAENRGKMERLNAFLAVAKADGTLADMQRRWIYDYPNSVMPEIPLTGENGVIKGVTRALTPPFSYMGNNGQLKGYTIELAKRFAANAGMGITFEIADADGAIQQVASGKSEFCFDQIAYSEERCRTFLCSESIYNDIVGIAVLKRADLPPAEKMSTGPIAWLKTGIERNLVKEKRWMLIVNGLKVTVIISLFAQILATALGLFVCYLLSRKNRVISYTAKFYKWLIHGTPMVVLLLIVYYVIFGKTDISPILVAVAAFAIVGSVNIGGGLRSAILTIDKTEIETALSMGFTPFGAFMTVTFPQAVKRALPGYLNGFVGLVKETAIVGFIAIQDLSRAGDIIRSRTYDAYFPLLFVAAIYLVVTTVCITMFKLIIKKINARAQARA